MAQAIEGDVVRIHYAGATEDGTKLDSSEGEPLEFTIGEGRTLPGIEDAVVGMEPEERKSLILSPEDAYGSHQEELVVEMDRRQLPDDLAVGQYLDMGHPSLLAKVTALSESTVTVDTNHPFAGQELTLDILLEEVL